MTRVLVLTSSILGGNSQALADHFSALAGERDGVEITRRDLVVDELPHLGLAELSSWQVAPEARDAEQRQLAARSDALIEELLAHDVVVLGVPLYNLGLPTQMKAWFDRVLRAGVTFRYTEDGPQGLLEDKRVIVAFASGGTGIDSAADFASGYLRFVLGFLGITDVTFVAADQLAVDAEGTIARAHAQIDALRDAA